MVENLSKHYGKLIAEDSNGCYYSFPQIDELARDGVEPKLRQLGFGYRAGYISKSAKQLHGLGGRSYLLELRKLPYDEARAALLKLCGVGPKVIIY